MDGIQAFMIMQRLKECQILVKEIQISPKSVIFNKHNTYSNSLFCFFKGILLFMAYLSKESVCACYKKVWCALFVS
jgi:hypothetical protein